MGRLVHLQVTNGGQGAVFLREQGALRTVRSAEIPVYRGLITDRNGAPLALSSRCFPLGKPPAAQRQSASGRACAHVGSRCRSVARQAGFLTSKQFMYLAQHHAEFAREVLRERFIGVHGSGSTMYYPAGEVTAQIVG